MIRQASLFCQALSLIPRHIFNREVNRLQGDRHAKGFTCWDQMVAMLFCHLASANSLREICGGLACTLGKIKHLGLTDAPSKSTLSYANKHRPWQLYESMFYEVLKEAQHLAGQQKQRFKFKNPLVSLDATTIDLCITMYDWARFRRTKGAIKLHLQLDHRGCLPSWAVITDGATHEVNLAKTRHFEPGTIVAVDRGYLDYELFSQWCHDGVYFVTRAKSNMVYDIVEEREVPTNRSIMTDQIIKLRDARCTHLLRRVVKFDDEQGVIVFLTNHLEFGSTTIAAIYKERWQIELFFKAIKQNLCIKTFVGTSANAVAIQIWTALIAILMLKIMTMRSRRKWSLSNLAALLRMNLLVYRDLWLWLDNPFEKPPPPKHQQLELFTTTFRTAREPHWNKNSQPELTGGKYPS